MKVHERGKKTTYIVSIPHYPIFVKRILQSTAKYRGEIIMIENAIKKLTAENKNFKGGNHESAMRQAVFDTLCEFCRQEPEFAQAVLQSNGTLSDCLKAVAKGVGGSISDLEAYKKAVCFYFPGADVRCVMTVDLIGDAAKSGKKISALEMSLDELF